MFFLLYTALPLLFSSVFVFLLLKKYRDIKILIAFSAIAYGIVYFLTTPAVVSWYFSNLPFPFIYMTTIIIYGSMLYSLLALSLIMIEFVKGLFPNLIKHQN
ncbi:MAG: hypothetical protein HYW63_00250 [Candidatus Levybacteria bacterium]|nr:hypothetical protein [Candidatus Levybacteria bacterium]